MSRLNNRLQENLRKRLKAALRRPANALCADCRITGPVWASTNLGIFICMDCAGVHRGMGTHITKVKSCTMDSWTKREVEFMESIGNEKGNSYWEARLPSSKHISANVDSRRRNEFIRNKYEKRMFYATPVENPSNKAQKEPKKTINRSREVKSTKPHNDKSENTKGIFEGTTIKENKPIHTSQNVLPVGRRQGASPWVSKSTTSRQGASPWVPKPTPSKPVTQPTITQPTVTQPVTHSPPTSLFEGMTFKNAPVSDFGETNTSKKLQQQDLPTEINFLNTEDILEVNTVQQSSTTTSVSISDIFECSIDTTTNVVTETTDVSDSVDKFDFTNSSFSFLHPEKKVENQEVIKHHDNIFNDCFGTTRRRSVSSPNTMEFANTTQGQKEQETASAFSFISNSGPVTPALGTFDVSSDLGQKHTTADDIGSGASSFSFIT